MQCFSAESYLLQLALFIQGGYHSSKSKVVFLSGNPSTTVVRTGVGDGFGIGRSTVTTMMLLTERFGPISSFSGSYRADMWDVNIVRSPGKLSWKTTIRMLLNLSNCTFYFISIHSVHFINTRTTSSM